MTIQELQNRCDAEWGPGRVVIESHAQDDGSTALVATHASAKLQVSQAYGRGSTPYLVGQAVESVWLGLLASSPHGPCAIRSTR